MFLRAWYTGLFVGAVVSGHNLMEIQTVDYYFAYTLAVFLFCSIQIGIVLSHISSKEGDA